MIRGSDWVSGSQIICKWCEKHVDALGALIVGGDLICEHCLDKLNDSELMRDRGLVRAMVEKSNSPIYFERIAALLEQDPSNPFWAFALHSNSGNEKTEALAVRWLRLNVENPNLYFLSSFLSYSSPAIMGALFSWMQLGGMNSKRMPPLIDDFVRTVAIRHGAMRAQAIQFANTWLLENPNNEYAGPVFGVIVSTTRSISDIRKSKEWYSKHKHHKRAWNVIAALLEIAYWDSVEPDGYAVEEAIKLLKYDDKRKQLPRLVVGLVSVWTTEQTIPWAREAYENTELSWILARLLRCAPDPYLIAKAENSMQRWIDTTDEPEMLQALLGADPNNKSARLRAELWTQVNPNHGFHTAIISALRQT